MANLSKEKRQRMIAFLQSIREAHTEDDSLIAINQIENDLTEKKYGLIWERHEEQVDTAMLTHIPVFVEDTSHGFLLDKCKPVNFIIEGDNLHALKLLAKTHKGGVDVIYIDPPYNTGAKDWKYNNDYVDKTDGFRHSKWLSMMNNRLEIAKTLLKPDGALVCAIDENELATTLLLIEEVFGEAYTSDCIAIVHNPRGVQGNNFSYVHEYAIFVYGKGLKIIGDREIALEDVDYSNLRNWGTESERSDAKNCFYPIYVKDGEIVGFGEIPEEDFHPQQNEVNEETGICAVYPIDVQGVERKWRYALQSVDGIKDLLRVKVTDGRYEIEIGKDFGSYRTVWTDKKYDANEYGTQLINSMVPENDFDFPKSLYNVYDCLYAVIKDRPNAVILDYFAGSGTTGHAVMLMNKNLGGNRRFILCTNNAIGEKKEKEFAKNYGAPEKQPEAWAEYEERYGIARSVTYPRIRAVAYGYIHSKDFKTNLLEKNVTLTVLKKADRLLAEIEKIKSDNAAQFDSIKVGIDKGVIKVEGLKKKGETIEGISVNVKYYKTSYIPKSSDDEDYSVESTLLHHIGEMVQLENGIALDGGKYILVFNDDEIDALAADFEKLDRCRTLYVSAAVLLTGEQSKLFESKGISVNIIPDYYFEYELKEVAER